MRRALKAAVARTLHATGTDRLLGVATGTYRRPLVLGFHRVVPDRAAAERWLSGISISVQTLERHLDWIGGRFRFVTLDELGDHTRGRPVAAVTFDDGYADVYENAFPLLKKKGIPAAIFVVTDLVGTTRALDHDRLYLALSTLLEDEGGPARCAGIVRPWVPRSGPLPRDPAAAVTQLIARLPNEVLGTVIDSLEAEARRRPEAPAELRCLTWSMLEEMLAGGITIASHTRTHALLPGAHVRSAYDELVGSREVLERRLRTRVVDLAYPYGRFDVDSIEAAAAAGYHRAYTTCTHTDRRHPWLTVPRKMMWERSSLDGTDQVSDAIVSCHVNGVFELVPRCRQRHRLTIV